MNTKKTKWSFADCLLLGSHNIDRMIDELTQLTRMLIGLILPSTPCSQRLTFVSEDNTVLWVVTFGENALSQKFIRMMAYTTFSTCPIFDSFHPESSIRAMVQDAYEGRDLLVNGLLEKFPTLQAELNPFIAASEVKFPD